MSWYGFVEGWHEFYLMAGTAAVTLAGLLFVAISLHVDALIHETREHLLALARATLSSFVFVLVVALILLIPQQSIRVTGTMLLAIGAIFFVATVRQIRGPAVDHAEFGARLFRRRLIVPLMGYAGTAGVGAALLARHPDMLYLLVGVTVLLLGNAAGTSWDLLVRVARIRRGSSGPGPRG